MLTADEGINVCVYLVKESFYFTPFKDFEENLSSEFEIVGFYSVSCPKNYIHIEHYYRRWKVYAKRRGAGRKIVRYLMSLIYSPWLEAKKRPGLGYLRLVKHWQDINKERLVS